LGKLRMIMMRSLSSSQSYQRCPSCRLSHQDGPKHVYKSTHKNKLKKIIDKAGAKLKDLTHYLDSPTLRETSTEPAITTIAKPAEKNYWCWFCEDEVDNSTNRFFCEATFRHLSRRAHHKTVHAFWQTTAAPAREKQQFLLTPARWEQFQRACEETLRRHEEEEKRRRQADEEHIHSLLAGKLLSSSSSVDASPSPSPSPSFLPPSSTCLYPRAPLVFPSSVPTWSSDHGHKPSSSTKSHLSTTKRQTSEAYGENLTRIAIPKLNEGEGNIHTGAMPPWLSSASSTGSSRPMPAQPLSPKEELQRLLDELKAKKRAQQQAKNPNRVGGWYVEMRKREQAVHDAGIIAETSGSKNEWLPSFGGVWNEGPRSEHARKYRAVAGASGRPARK